MFTTWIEWTYDMIPNKSPHFFDRDYWTTSDGVSAEMQIA